MIPCVIPYYKALLRLHKCKKHLKAQTMPVKIHVVNDSRKGTGYTATVNRGLRFWLNRASEWDYIVVCDQDMYLDNNAIEEMYKFLESHPKCGIAVCLQRLEGRTDFVDGSGIECYPIGNQLQCHISYYEKGAKPCWWGDVACMMVRKECMWDIGLLNENFRFICSDSDYTLTARSMGWEVWTPNAAGFHQRGKAAPKEYEGKTIKQISRNPIMKQMNRDREMFARKWLGSEYYQILKYEENKPIFIIRGNNVIPCDGQGEDADDLKERWLKELRKRNRIEKNGGKYTPTLDAGQKRLMNFGRAMDAMKTIKSLPKSKLLK